VSGWQDLVNNLESAKAQVLDPTTIRMYHCYIALKTNEWSYCGPQLFRDLAMARADGSLRLLLAKLSRIALLVMSRSAATSGRSAKTVTKRDL
jgi:hypothetical protein